MNKNDPVELKALTPVIAALQRAFEAVDAPHAFIGGVAVALFGDPRMTRDVDALVLLGSTPIESLLDAAAAHGIVPRIEDALAFAGRHNVLLLRCEPSGVTVDVCLALLPFEKQAIERAREVDTADISVSVLRPEDLIVMKAVAHRPVDLGDIGRIAAANPDLDRDHVINELRPFAEALDSPDLVDEIERLLQ